MSTATTKVHRVPGPIAIALQTGRPELARIGVQAVGKSMTQEELDELSDYVESVVYEIQAERDASLEMYKQVHMMVDNWRGTMNTWERIEEAFRLMSEGASPQAVQDALRNPKRKEETD